MTIRKYLTFFTAALSILMYAIDATVVSVAFPTFTKELHATVLWSAWTVSIYFIAVTLTMPLAGNLSDTFGRKRVFLISLLLFTGSSLACALAPSIHTLIIFRFFQGVGGACFLPTASGILSDHFPENRETVIGLLSSIFGIGFVVGPTLGGIIVSQYSWRYVFYINVPIGLFLMCLTMVLLRESGERAAPRIDFGGIGLMCGSLLSFMLALNTAGDSTSGFSGVIAGALAIAAIILAAIFLKHEKSVQSPLIETRLLESKAFAAANAANLVVGMTSMGLSSVIPLYAVSVHKLSTLMSGMIVTPRSLAMTVTAAVSSFLLKKVGYRWPMVIGFVWTGITILFLAPDLFGAVSGSAWEGVAGTLSAIMLMNGMGTGMIFPAANNACIELMPEKVGTIVGLRNMFRNIGGALAVSLVTLILHLSRDASTGFTLVFLAFGLLPMATVPLLFLMPAGKRQENKEPTVTG